MQISLDLLHLVLALALVVLAVFAMRWRRETNAASLARAGLIAARQMAEIREQAAREALGTGLLERDQRVAERLAEREAAFEKERAAILALKKEAEERFQAMAAEALARNNRQFLSLAEESLARRLETADGGLKALMSPVEDSFRQFREKIGEIEKIRAEDRAAMVEQMRAVAEQMKDTQDSTRRLAFALKANPKTRGRWGEEQLRNILELSGLSKFADFDEQTSARTEDGLLRPDVRVRLPGGRIIVIDSKVSLDAYLDGVDAVDEKDREAAFVRHARQIRTHMEQLASKQYWRNIESAVDFVAMFVPGENFFAAAAERDAELMSAGLERRVMIVTPVTLMSLLKAVAYGWRQEESALNARAIAELGQALYDRMAKMGELLDKLGARIGASVDGYNELVGSIETKVMPGARKFLDYGAGGSKDLPEIRVIEQAPRALVMGKDLLVPTNSE